MGLPNAEDSGEHGYDQERPHESDVIDSHQEKEYERDQQKQERGG